jgi:hypothetical protein
VRLSRLLRNRCRRRGPTPAALAEDYPKVET